MFSVVIFGQILIGMMTFVLITEHMNVTFERQNLTFNPFPKTIAPLSEIKLNGNKLMNYCYCSNYETVKRKIFKLTFLNQRNHPSTC